MTEPRPTTTPDTSSEAVERLAAQMRFSECSIWANTICALLAERDRLKAALAESEREACGHLDTIGRMLNSQPQRGRPYHAE